MPSQQEVDIALGLSPKIPALSNDIQGDTLPRFISRWPCICNKKTSSNMKPWSRYDSADHMMSEFEAESFCVVQGNNTVARGNQKPNFYYIETSSGCFSVHAGGSEMTFS